MCLVSITYIQCVATLYIVVYIQYDDSGMSQSHWLCVAVKTVVDEAFDAAAAAASYCKTPDEDDDGVSINIEFVWQLSVCLSVCLVYVVWNTAMHTHTCTHIHSIHTCKFRIQQFNIWSVTVQTNQQCKFEYLHTSCIILCGVCTS